MGWEGDLKGEHDRRHPRTELVLNRTLAISLGQYWRVSHFIAPSVRFSCQVVIPTERELEDMGEGGYSIISTIDSHVNRTSILFSLNSLMRGRTSPLWSQGAAGG